MPSEPSSLFYYPFWSGDLLVAAAVLLVLAAFLLVLSSRRKIALRHSEVTEELMLYLARMTDALEIQCARTPERMLAEPAAALKQPNVPAPVQTAGNDANTVRHPLHNVEIPPRR
jgi:hypothetical protein